MIKHAAFKARINQRLETTLNALECPCPRLKEAILYAVLGGGKRTRGILSYLVGESLGLPPASIDPIAMAIECLHAYTLIHDDLPAMDDDDMRRHKPSCHIAFDEATAILAGDALQAEAFSLLLTTPTEPKHITTMLRYFSQAVGANGLCSGQSLDMQQHADHVTIDQLKQSHRLKTGVLFAVACTLPGIIANGTKQEIQALQEAGEAIGMLFQINDDIIDQTDDLTSLGKTPGKDREKNKASFANCLDKTKLTLEREHSLRSCQDKLVTAKLEQILTQDLPKKA